MIFYFCHLKKKQINYNFTVVSQMKMMLTITMMRKDSTTFYVPGTKLGRDWPASAADVAHDGPGFGRHIVQERHGWSDVAGRASLGVGYARAPVGCLVSAVWRSHSFTNA